MMGSVMYSPVMDVVLRPPVLEVLVTVVKEAVVWVTPESAVADGVAQLAPDCTGLEAELVLEAEVAGGFMAVEQ